MSPADKAMQVPRVVMFSGKAAPGYHLAKRIIKLVHCVATVVNSDPDIDDELKVVFLPNYNVSLAELIIPAADLSQQISCAGMEASGTGNMKQAMNGALIIGTLDGANVEIGEECGWSNLFLFGARASEVPALRDDLRFGTKTAASSRDDADAAAAATPEEGDLVGATALSAAEMADGSAALERVLAAIRDGQFGDAEGFGEILNEVEPQHDYYLLRQDWPSYCVAQQRVQDVYADERQWTRMSIMSSAGCGKFSSDRTIKQYCEDMWGITPLRRPDPEAGRRAEIDPSVDEMLSPQERADASGIGTAEDAPTI